jgi:hypothetical protein
LLPQVVGADGDGQHRRHGRQLFYGRTYGKVHLNLSPSNPDETPGPAYGALSDDAGHFSMAAIQPGEYRLQAERVGYIEYPTVAQAPSGIIVRSFRAGERVTGYQLEMAPKVVITGRVLDENGEPVPRVGVTAQRRPQATPIHTSPFSFGRTDDRGAYRLAVAPDRYYVVVMAPAEDQYGPEVRADGSVERPYLPTYYPSALSRELAGVVDARAGGVINGIDIRPIRSAMLHLNGALSGIPPGATGSQVVLKNSAGLEEKVANPGADGHFAFGPLEPATYRMYGQTKTQEGTWRTPIVEIKLTASLDFVPLALSRGFDLTGRLSGIAPAGQTIELTNVRAPNDAMPIPGGAATVAADGSFTIKGVQSGAYEVSVAPLPDNAYLRSVRLGNTDAVDAVIDLRGGSTSAALTVAVSEAGGQISGSLETAGGNPLRQRGFVYVVEDGKEFSRPHIHGADTSPDGEFTVQGLAPGKYRMFADVYGVTPLPPEVERAAAMEKYAAAAELVEIHEGDKLVKNAKVAGTK